MFFLSFKCNLQKPSYGNNKNVNCFFLLLRLIKHMSKHSKGVVGVMRLGWRRECQRHPHLLHNSPFTIHLFTIVHISTRAFCMSLVLKQRDAQIAFNQAALSALDIISIMHRQEARAPVEVQWLRAVCLHNRLYKFRAVGFNDSVAKLANLCFSFSVFTNHNFT